MPDTPYNAFAWFYNRHWGAPWLERILPVLDAHLLPGLPEGAAILDLCCGSGHLAAEFGKRGYRVFGVDNSVGQLAFARENAPQAQLIEAEASCFTLPEPVHAAYSVFDSLNHVMKREELEQVFASVYRALLPGGRFFFDMNVEPGFRQNWMRANVIIEPDHIMAGRTSYDEASRIGKFDAVLFRLIDGQWKRQDIVFVQYAYAPETIRQALDTAGFEIEFLGDAGEFGLDLTGRLAVLAHRP